MKPRDHICGEYIDSLTCVNCRRKERGRAWRKHLQVLFQEASPDWECWRGFPWISNEDAPYNDEAIQRERRKQEADRVKGTALTPPECTHPSATEWCARFSMKVTPDVCETCQAMRKKGGEEGAEWIQQQRVNSLARAWKRCAHLTVTGERKPCKGCHGTVELFQCGNSKAPAFSQLITESICADCAYKEDSPASS